MLCTSAINKSRKDNQKKNNTSSQWWIQDFPGALTLEGGANLFKTILQNFCRELLESERNLAPPLGSSKVIVSLHIHSMWETICDAVASSSGINLRSKIPVYPILPRKPTPMKSCQIWGTLDGFSCPEYPSPQKMKSCQIWDPPWREVQGARMWGLIYVSPADTISFLFVENKIRLRGHMRQQWKNII